MNSLQYRHVDVFSDQPFSGNGLTVFVLENELSTEVMQVITQETRQFESIFLIPTKDSNAFRARVFTVEEELDFAGHPVLGAAAVLHEKFSDIETAEWQIKLNAKAVAVQTTRNGSTFRARMNQGKPEFIGTVADERHNEFLRALNLSKNDLDPQLPMEIVSTGLPYLIVAVKRNLETAKIIVPNFEEMLETVGAKFVYVFDAARMEGRTWDNFGIVEDVATGSAAGPTAAFLVKHNLAQPEITFELNQGGFLNRPSRLLVKATGTPEGITSIEVAGDVCFIAKGSFDRGII